jgi:hypothetical protein
LGPNILLSILFSNPLNLCSSRILRGKPLGRRPLGRPKRRLEDTV